jgi:hypothetical protein
MSQSVFYIWNIKWGRFKYVLVINCICCRNVSDNVSLFSKNVSATRYNPYTSQTSLCPNVYLPQNSLSRFYPVTSNCLFRRYAIAWYLGHPVFIHSIYIEFPGFKPGLVMWDLWWTKWRWGRFSRSTSISSANPHSTKFLYNHDHYHPWLVQ